MYTHEVAYNVYKNTHCLFGPVNITSDSKTVEKYGVVSNKKHYSFHPQISCQFLALL